MANEYVGKKLNVETRKGVHQETIIKQLSTKGIVRTEEGNEFNIADLRKKGRGIFVTAAGGAKPKAAAASVAAENTRKPAERTASAVTADELEDKRVNGVAVSKILKRAGIVKLEDGTELMLADIVRKGRGYATESAAPAPTAKGGAIPKSAKAAKADADDEGETVTNAELRGTNAKIRIDGKLHTIVSTIKGEKFKTDKGYKGETGDIRKVGGKLVIESDEYKAAQAPAPEPVAKPAAPARAPAPIKRSELKGKNITVGDEVHVMEKTLKSDEVITNKGFRFSVADVARKGRGYVYTGEIVAKKGGAVPRTRTAPEPVSQIVSVAAFDNDTAADISDLMEKAIRTALADSYDVDVVSSFIQYEDQMATISFQISTADAPAAFVKGKVSAFQNSMAAQAIADPAPTPAAPKKDAADFEQADLVNEEDEDDDVLDAENDVPETDDEDLDVEDDDEDTSFPEEKDEDEDEDEDEEEVEVEVEEGDDSFDEEEVEEISFPEDTTELVEQGAARLKGFFPTKTMTGFISRWYASQDVFDAIAYEIEPGMTVTIEDHDYVLVGLKQDGDVLLANVKTGTARPSVDLDALQIIVAEHERAMNAK